MNEDEEYTIHMDELAKNLYYWARIRFIPDVITDEEINVGVLIHDEKNHRVWIKTVASEPDWQISGPAGSIAMMMCSNIEEKALTYNMTKEVDLDFIIAPAEKMNWDRPISSWIYRGELLGLLSEDPQKNLQMLFNNQVGNGTVVLKPLKHNVSLDKS